tara:strand:+ start:543 stop:932 length:390 start_codon:yes stop_codon:yes gene_type:complete
MKDTVKDTMNVQEKTILCDCCEKQIIGKPWLSVKNHINKEKIYHVCSYSCSNTFTEKYGDGYWNDIINKEDFNEPRPVFEIYRIKEKRKDITSEFDVEKIREEIEIDLSEESDYEDYSSTEDELYEENY